MLLDASLEAALLQIKQACPRLSAEMIPMADALGRVTASEYLAKTDLPAQAQSAVDGYAVAGLDGGEFGRYTVIGSAFLGDNPITVLTSGQAMQVKTGGVIPPGTMAVVPHEKTQVMNDSLKALETIKIGNNIKQAGEDFAIGQQIIARDRVITPADIALMAAFGIDNISVYRRPRVAIFCLSNNVVPWHQEPKPGQTRDTNTLLLQALVQDEGGLVTRSELASLDERPAKEIVLDMLDQADILLLIGGTYADQGNEARLLMEELSATLLYWDVPIQPGSHTGAAKLHAKILFALSGNPAACAVGYHLFVAPALKALQGLNPDPIYVNARCVNGFHKKSGSRRFIRGKIYWDRKGWKVEVLPGQKPSMLRSLIGCNTLIDIPAGSLPIAEGQEVSCLLMKTFFE